VDCVKQFGLFKSVLTEARGRHSILKPATKLIVILTVIFVIIAATVGALMIFNKSANLIDSEFSVIVTGSMDGEPTDYEISTIPVHSLIAVHKMKGDMVEDVKIGDVIGFYSPAVNGYVYHRVIEVDDVNRTFTTHGDANPVGTNEIVSFDEVHGIVVNVSHGAGEFVTFVKNNILYLIIFLVALFIMIEALLYLNRLWKE